MRLKDRIMRQKIIRDYILEKKYGLNVHEVDITENVQTGIVDRLMNARERSVEYAVTLDGVVPIGTAWDKYGDGTWNPKKSYITTDDIKTQNKDRYLEEQKIYDFLRGKSSNKDDLNLMLASEEKETEDEKLRK